MADWRCRCSSVACVIAFVKACAIACTNRNVYHPNLCYAWALPKTCPLVMFTQFSDCFHWSYHHWAFERVSFGFCCCGLSCSFDGRWRFSGVRWFSFWAGFMLIETGGTFWRWDHCWR
jgi:hypothetical protein